MDSDAHACPVCGQPVDTVVRRHKTLGAWVPVWVAGPCRNRECSAYAEEGVRSTRAHSHSHSHADADADAEKNQPQKKP